MIRDPCRHCGRSLHGLVNTAEIVERNIELQGFRDDLFTLKFGHTTEYATMSNTAQVVTKATKKKRTKWDEAITDAKLKVASLRKTIEVYQVRRDAGDPWPGESATRN